MRQLELIRDFLSAEFYNFIFYIILLSIVTLVFFGIDKYKAMRRKWRIPEAVLLSLTVIGGAFGGIIGMILFRHKIRKPMFFIIVPLATALYIALIIYVVSTPYGVT